MDFAKKIKIVIILLAINLANCSSGGQIYQGDVNAKFESLYGSQVQDILKQKNSPAIDYKENVQALNFNSDSEFKKFNYPSQVFGIDAPNSQRSKFETHKLFLKQPQMHFPNMTTFIEGHKNFSPDKIPSDIFEIKYSTAQHPPFQVTGIDFDLIVIPQKDAHGISSSLEEKRYPIPPRNILSKDVQYLLAKRSKDDIEFSQELISQNELIRKQIAVNKLYFADNYQKPVSDYEQSFHHDNSKEDWVIAKKENEEHEVTNLIRNQVIIKNLRSAISNTTQNSSNNNQQNSNAKQQNTQSTQNNPPAQ